MDYIKAFHIVQEKLNEELDYFTIKGKNDKVMEGMAINVAYLMEDLTNMLNIILARKELSKPVLTLVKCENKLPS